MNTKSQTLDESFIRKQRERLVAMRKDLLDQASAGEHEGTDLNAQSAGEAQESEDDAQRLALLEVGQNLVVRNRERLAGIERALQKIADGSYGVSDASGESIPRERLEAIPETIYTLKEIEARETASE